MGQKEKRKRSEDSEESKAVQKLRFCTDAVASRDRFVNKVVVEDELAEAVQWLAETTPEEVRTHVRLITSE